MHPQNNLPTSKENPKDSDGHYRYALYSGNDVFGVNRKKGLTLDEAFKLLKDTLSAGKSIADGNTLKYIKLQRMDEDFFKYGEERNADRAE